MIINYLGHSCFKLRGKSKTVVCDPFAKSIGFLMPKTKADVVTISHNHEAHSALDRVEGEPFVVQGPGEYEIGGVFVYGWLSWHDNKKGEERGKNTIYNINFDGLKICHLGDLGHMLGDKILEEISGVDVLMFPAGNESTISPKEAIELIEKIDPKIAIPMHFRTPAHSTAYDKYSTVDDFIAQWNRKVITEDKLNTDQVDEQEECQLVVLKI